MVDRRLPMDWTHFWTRELAQGMLRVASNAGLMPGNRPPSTCDG